ncbi:zona pellucida sperm-binding protein 3-like isoform 2-T2 [Pholidichthys leucotaenia]
MALVWHAALLLSLIAVTLVTAEMTVDCRSGYVTVVWKESRAHHDTSRFRLGNCEPTTLTPGEAVFSVDFSYCDFMQLVTGNKLIYANNLTYTSPPNSLIPSFTNQVKCQYERPKDWYPLLYEPAFQTYGVEDLVFHIGLMNADFSGPAESTNFSLGSMIPIMASVEQKNHQPLMLLLDECEAATTPDLRPGSKMYPIITNKGYLFTAALWLGTPMVLTTPRRPATLLKIMVGSCWTILHTAVYVTAVNPAANPGVKGVQLQNTMA